MAASSEQAPDKGAKRWVMPGLLAAALGIMAGSGLMIYRSVTHPMKLRGKGGKPGAGKAGAGGPMATTTTTTTNNNNRQAPKPTRLVEGLPPVKGPINEDQVCPWDFKWDFGLGDRAKEATPDDLLFTDPATKFPKDFKWGTTTAAFQIEGAVAEDGRGPSIWDTYQQLPGKIENGDNATLACDHYHRYKEDVALMKKLGYKNYRFSIAWARVVPKGEGKVNSKGLDWYSNLVDELLKNDIEPVITLYHWDLPQGLEDQYQGWLGDKTTDAFVAYADAVWGRLGDRVKTWVTFNEPWCVTLLGYGLGFHAPGRNDTGILNQYTAAHNVLRAHAKAVKLYRNKYKPTQKGQVGITLNTEFKQAACDTPWDRKAALRSAMFSLGWFADPIFFGDYPKEMRDIVKVLPNFTDAEKKDLAGSVDFLGLNHYTTLLVRQPAWSGQGDYWSDMQQEYAADPAWPTAESKWLHFVPWGFRRLLVFIKERYNTPIIVTENGASEPDESKWTDDQLDDKFRQAYIKGYVAEMYKAIAIDKVDVRGYFVWSFYDNFEWADGYRPRFGLVRVNFTSQERIPKKSAIMYSDLIKRHSS